MNITQEHIQTFRNIAEIAEETLDDLAKQKHHSEAFVEYVEYDVDNEYFSANAYVYEYSGCGSSQEQVGYLTVSLAQLEDPEAFLHHEKEKMKTR